MKLAEMLLLRTDYQDKIESLKLRIYANIKVQEGDSPNEDPRQLLNEASDTYDRLTDLIQKINRTNETTILPDGQRLSDVLVARDTIAKRRALLTSVANKANEQDHRLSRSEIKMGLAINLRDLQKEMDAISMQYRKLDTLIQSVNWTTEVE